MPKGPRGEKRPADVIGAAIMVGKAFWSKRPTEELQQKLKLKEAASPGAKVIIEILNERGVGISN